VIEERSFRKRSSRGDPIIDDGLGDAHHLIPLRQLWKFRGFYHVCGYLFALHGELVGQAHGLRAVRSGWRNEHLQVNRLD
jgi:hypothetical protein